MADKPEVVAWFVDEPVSDDDPLAAVKHRARAHLEANEVLAEVDHKVEVEVRADRLAEAAAMLCCGAFDADDTWEAGLAAGLSDLDLDAAGNVALILARIEADGAA